ncbi:M56 family metallopeptidase [Paenibacillus apiarius]|uniref:M56 family metallopeptidase n=1 Tax=Paenibacillus apiarius TaxID=46240 RepID=A0ABT4DQ14_9BACL|nr:M56 family metallopeptidase [Paenibacillus apiarius]MBN3524135.1 M56 family metallopeptidase [Paenibacillus apiarius]MCY9513922.1 M56 family metallopeptidase [Paenibacillus apiarius]MCY9519439.1 M56 family metallopeptidase [Paenibacillus apiarius]MCY9552334.1 M56 family metallopeptidase [Paenibacillus apiarius]MCY9556194.1 M56 family metallopeptidase [Paenibacillus apiarius]
MWNNRSRLIFGSSVLIAAIVLCQMGMYAMQVLAGWELHFNLVEACSTLMQNYGLSTFVYALDALVFYTLFLMLFAAVRQTALSKNAYKRLKTYRHEWHTEAFNRTYNGGRERIVVIECRSPIAFTMGLWKPRIVISTGLMELLDSNELEAVIYHEMYHLKHRDPLKTFAVSLFASIMWYLPILKWSRQKYKIAREVLADHYAISRLGTPAHLGSALFKMLKRGQAAPMPFSYVSFADTSINYRIQQLVDPETDDSWKLPFTPAMISLQVLLALCAMFIVALS